MRDIDKTKPVLVTGGTGYIASWIIKMLLDQGITVHTTVRNPGDKDKTGSLTSLADTSEGTLKLFRADLMKNRSFDEAMEGCELVIHTASPFLLVNVDDPENTLIRPAAEGTRNVLDSATRTVDVKRVVLTSSTAAVYGDNADIAQKVNGMFTENDWNTSSSLEHQPYPYSKTLAEKQAWAIAEQQEQWDLVVINPGWVLGPSVSKRTDSASIKTMIEFGNGTFKSGVPEFHTCIVDVRDVARAHINAGFNPDAKGRHIVVGTVAPLIDIAEILKNHFGDTYPFPRMQAPNWLFWLIAPLYKRTRRYVKQNMGIKIRFDTSYSIADLDLSYTPLEKTVTDHFQQILDDGLLEKR